MVKITVKKVASEFADRNQQRGLNVMYVATKLRAQT